MRSKLLILAILLLSITMAGQAFAVTATVTPSQVPKGAYVNGPGGVNDDNFYWQAVTLTLEAADADGSTITINLPTGLHVANVNGNAGNTAYSDEVALSVNSSSTIAVDGAGNTTAAKIQLNLTDPATIGDVITVMFPVTSDLSPAAGPYVYGVVCSDVAETALVTAPTITYRDAGALALVSTTAIFSGDNDSTSTYGQNYPAAAAALWGALPDLVNDAAGFTLTPAADAGIPVAADNNIDTDDVSYTLWAATDSTLGHVNVLTSGVTRAVMFDGATPGVNYVVHETATGATASIATAALPEGNYYFYVTSTLTGDFPIFRSGQLHIQHYPEVKLLGFDYDLSGTYSLVADDNALTLDTGGYIGNNGTVGATVSDNVDVYVNVDDYDDNARVALFYSSDAGLTASSIVTSGTAPNLTVTGLTGATLLADTLYENKKDTEGYISWNWSVVPVGSSFIPAADYTLYAVACDGKHTSLMVSCGATPGSTEKISIKHSPSIQLDVLDEYDTDIATAPININTANVDVIMLSWGKKGVGEDSDIDDNAVISLYVAEDIGVAGQSELASNGDVATLTGIHQIVAGLQENPDSKAGSYYAWNLKADYAATGWFPAAGTSYNVYAVIDENKSGGIRRVVALGDATEPLQVGDAIDQVIFTNNTYVRVYDPPIDGVTVYGDQTYRMRLSASDLDANANLGVWVVNTNTTGFTAPAKTTVADLLVANPVAPGGKVYCLTSSDGDDLNGAGHWLTENTASYYDITMRLPSEAASFRYTHDIETNVTSMVNGTYWVYVGGAVAGDTLYRAPGTITFRNISSLPTQKNLMITPTVFSSSLGDTLTFTVGAADGGTIDADQIDAYIAVDKKYFDVVTVGSPPAPFTDVSATGSLIANTVTDDAVNNKWILRFNMFNGTSSLALANADFGSPEVTFQLVSKGTTDAISASSTISFTNSTKFYDDGKSVSITLQENTAIIEPRGIIEGIAQFDGRTIANCRVTFDLRPRGSYVNIVDSVFYAQNDADPSTPGIQYTLDNDGKFTLMRVPSGTYDFAVSYDRYLSKKQEIRIDSGLDTLFVNFATLLGGDCYGYVDSTGAVLPNNRVDIGDINRISDAFLATSANAKWNDGTNNYKWADINEDGTVEIADLQMAAFTYASANASGSSPVWAKTAAGDNTASKIELSGLPSTLVAGKSYTVDVTISGASAVRGYYVSLGYDVSDISIDDIVDGGFITESSVCFPVSGDGMIGLANAVYGNSVFSGSGVLVKVTFTAKKSGAFDAGTLSLKEVSVVNGGMLKETLTGSTDGVDIVPSAFALGQNFPNPFNPTTTISFSVPSASNVTLKIYDVLGRNVRTLVSGNYLPGSYSVMWDARDARGSMVSSGMYFYSIKVGSYHATKRMLFLK